MQIEIDDVEKIAVGGDVGGGGEEAEPDLAEDAIIFGRIFDGGTEWAAVADRRRRNFCGRVRTRCRVDR